jgi:hypothetical protein
MVRALYIPDRVEKSVKGHWEIYKNLAVGEGKMVEKAIVTHFKNSLNDIKNEFI